MHHTGDQHVGVVGELLGVDSLRLRLQGVVQFLRDPVAQLGDQRLDVQPRDQWAQQAGEAAELDEVGEERLARPRVLDLDRDGAPVVPDRAVHLPDGGGGGRAVVEGAEQ